MNLRALRTASSSAVKTEVLLGNFLIILSGVTTEHLTPAEDLDPSVYILTESACSEACSRKLALSWASEHFFLSTVTGQILMLGFVHGGNLEGQNFPYSRGKKANLTCRVSQSNLERFRKPGSVWRPISRFFNIFEIWVKVR